MGVWGGLQLSNAVTKIHLIYTGTCISSSVISPKSQQEHISGEHFEVIDLENQEFCCRNSKGVSPDCSHHHLMVGTASVDSLI